MENNQLDRPSTINIRQISWGSVIWMFITTLVVFIPNVSPWIATPFVLVGLIAVLGYLLAINLKITIGEFSEYVIYSIGLGLGFLLIGGLIVNWVLPYIGVAHPLGKVPLMIFFDIATLVLALRAYLFNKNYIFSYTFKLPNKTNIFFGAVPWLFVVASV